MVQRDAGLGATRGNAGQPGKDRSREDRSREDRLVTIPNMLSLLRLAGVPLFLWLLLGPRLDLLALVVLVVSGITDWLDGKLARWLDQSSRLGALLDPAVDRLYVFAAIVAFVLRGIVPRQLRRLAPAPGGNKIVDASGSAGH